MPKKGSTPERIIGLLRQAEVELKGRTVGEVCRGLGISEASFYRWRSEYGGLKVDQVRRMGEAPITRFARDKAAILRSLSSLPARATASAFASDLAVQVDWEGKQVLKVRSGNLPNAHLIVECEQAAKDNGPTGDLARTRQNLLRQRSETNEQDSRDKQAGYEARADNRHEMVGMIRV